MAIDYSDGLQQGLSQRAAYGLYLVTFWLDYLGIPYRWTSGYRSYAEQAQLYANRGSNPYPVAAPGTSRHESGEAFDLVLERQFQPWLGVLAPYAGLRWGGAFSTPDPIHLEAQ